MFRGARPLLLNVILVIASILGVIGYLKMPRNMYPDVERPQVTVITQLPGVAAQSVAQKVSRQIEQELYAISKVRDVQSTNKNEVSIVRAEFEYEKGLDAALLDVNNALSGCAQAACGCAAFVGVCGRRIHQSGAGADAFPQARQHHYPGANPPAGGKRYPFSALVTQPDVANVEVFGGYEPAVRVEFDPRWHATALPGTVAGAARQTQPRLAARHPLQGKAAA